MTSKGEYDCIVIGAGVQGSFTAYQLTKRNKKTLLLEQVCQIRNFAPEFLSSAALSLQRILDFSDI